MAPTLDELLRRIGLGDPPLQWAACPRRTFLAEYEETCSALTFGFWGHGYVATISPAAERESHLCDPEGYFSRGTDPHWSSKNPDEPNADHPVEAPSRLKEAPASLASQAAANVVPLISSLQLGSVAQLTGR